MIVVPFVKFNISLIPYWLITIILSLVDLDLDFVYDLCNDDLKSAEAKLKGEGFSFMEDTKVIEPIIDKPYLNGIEPF